MRFSVKILLIIFFALFVQLSSAFAQNQSMTPTQMQAWIQEALEYGFNMENTDLTKYVSTDYTAEIDGQTMNFEQWQHHILYLRTLMKSYSLHFNTIVAQGDQVAASYDVTATKKDGTVLKIRILEFFTVQNGKMIHGDELTHLLSGPASDKNLSDHS